VTATSSPDVVAFVEGARAYAAFIARAATLPLAARLGEAREHLLVLYRAGSRLPDLEPPDDDVPRIEVPEPAPWSGFDHFEHYWEYFDPYIEADQVVASLSDDLLDVYRDVMRGLALWDAGLPPAAIWEWRFYFEHHWGDHAIDALRALHRATRQCATANDHHSE
jgi:hypothetical protein